MNSNPDTTDTALQEEPRVQAGSIQEQIWVLQAQQGDEEAFARLVDLFPALP